MYINLHFTYTKCLEDVHDKFKDSPEEGLEGESCTWFNLIMDFLFKELRDTPRIKRFE